MARRDIFIGTPFLNLTQACGGRADWGPKLDHHYAPAWHAGSSFWQGYTHFISNSISIEIVNLGNGGNPNAKYAECPDSQIKQVIELVRDVERRHGVRPDRVLGHSDIQPMTKQDPGRSLGG